MTLKAKFINYFLGAICFLGLVLNCFEVELYRETIIHWAIPTTIWIATGLIFTPIMSSLLTKYSDMSTPFRQVVFNILALGGIITYLFMAVNYYFPSDQVTFRKVQIIKTGQLAKGRWGCANPYADVKINGVEKQVIFPCYKSIDNSRYLNLTMKKGFLGFEIIKSKTALEE